MLSLLKIGHRRCRSHRGLEEELEPWRSCWSLGRAAGALEERLSLGAKISVGAAGRTFNIHAVWC